MLKSVKNIKPLSQDNLGKGGNQHNVHGFQERGLRTPTTPGSTKRTQTPPAGVPRAHVHLPAFTISLPEEVSGYESNIPHMCSPDRMTLQPRTNSVRVHRVTRADQIPLTESSPHQERHWKVPDLNDNQDVYNVRSRGYTRAEIVRALKCGRLGSPRKKSGSSRTENVLRFPCVANLFKEVRFLSVSVTGEFHYLVP